MSDSNNSFAYLDDEPSPAQVRAYQIQSQRRIDALSPAWRKLVHAYGFAAEEAFDDVDPITTRRKTPERAAKELAGDFGVDLLPEQSMTRKPRRRERRHPRGIYL